MTMSAHTVARLTASLQVQQLLLALPFQLAVVEPLQVEQFAFTDTESKNMIEEPKPLLIQIDDEVREMTPEEIAEHEALIADSPTLPSPE